MKKRNAALLLSAALAANSTVTGFALAPDSPNYISEEFWAGISGKTEKQTRIWKNSMADHTVSCPKIRRDSGMRNLFWYSGSFLFA